MTPHDFEIGLPVQYHHKKGDYFCVSAAIIVSEPHWKEWDEPVHVGSKFEWTEHFHAPAANLRVFGPEGEVEFVRAVPFFDTSRGNASPSHYFTPIFEQKALR